MFRYQIGDWVQSANGVLVGVVQERVYHDSPAGAHVKYYVHGQLHTGAMRRRALHELYEGNLEPAEKPDDWEPS